MLRVSPIYGSRWSEQGEANEPECTLVEFASFKILMNLGWWSWSHEEFPELPPHDCIILTASTLQCIGGLPLYYQKYKDNLAPIYATFPTVKMGQMALYDQHAAISLDGGAPPYSLEDLDDIISKIQSIKYSQAILLPPEQPILSLTAHYAGHVLGGAFYILQRLQDETTVVLLNNYNIARELHLDSTTLLQHASSPDVLVTKPGGPPFRQLTDVPVPKLVSQKQRELTEGIMSVLRRDGNVLIPVDAAGRVLEIVYLLQQHWEKNRLAGAYNLCWLGPMVSNTVEFARSQIEWMRSKLGDGGDNPFTLKGVHFCSSINDLPDNENPTCVLASGLSLEGGPSRDLLLKWADNADNAIIFTDSSECYLRRRPTVPIPEDDGAMVGNITTEVSEWTTSGQLLKAFADAHHEGREMDDSVIVDVNVPYRTALTGAELKAFLAQEEEKLQEEKERQEQEAMKREVEIAKGELRLEEEEEPAKRKKIIKTKFMNPRKKSRFDSSLFFKYSKPQYLMFEAHDELSAVGQPRGIKEGASGKTDIVEDDYGTSVVPELFVDIVSGIDPSKIAGGSGRIGENVRIGYAGDKAGKVGGPNRISEEDDENVAMDEQALETIDLAEGRGIIRGRNGREPQKVRTAPRRLEVLAEINYIPLDGRVDTRSARQSVQALSPRNVIILGGPNDQDQSSIPDEVTALAEASKSMLVAESVVATPSNAEATELDIGHSAFDVRIIDRPYQTKEEKEDSDEPPEPVELQEAKLGLCSVALIDCIATGQKVALDGSIVIAPKKEASDEVPSVFVSDGEILLTDLRSELIAEGLKVDFRARQLLVNGKILVEKDQDTGRISVEGPLCEDFYTVRSVVYGQFVML